MTDQPADTLASREVITEQIAAHLAEVVKSGLAGVGTAATEELSKTLDPARVKQKPGSGHDYLPEHDVIRTANRIFGYGRWGTEIVWHEPVGQHRIANAKGEEGWYVGYRCCVRLTVAGCVPVDGVGYGDAFEKQWSAVVTAHELAAKEAESDAIKRAFKKFGDQFGLILWAKTDDRRRIAAEQERANPTPVTPEQFFGESGDRAATTGEIEGAVGLAAQVSDELKAQTEAAIAAHREGCRAEGCDVVSAAWLKKLAERIVEKQGADATRTAERLEQAGFTAPAGATAETTDAAVAGAFQDAA